MIKEIFEKGNILIPYFTFGDTSIENSEALVRSAFKSGADAVELGIPFSDPIADGPVIQVSHQRALKNKSNINLKDAFECVKRIKKDFNKPIIFMASVNLIYSYGINAFFEDAAKNGLNAVIIPDLSLEESDLYYENSIKNKVDLIYLISPMCSDARLEKIVNRSNAFIYLISTLGTTGVRKFLSSDLSNIVLKIKKIKNIPVIVGFGVSQKEHVAEINKFAQGVIVGSYLVKFIENNLDNFSNAIKQISVKIQNFKN